MSMTPTERDRLVDTKLALAQKYENLLRQAGSKKKRRTFQTQAEKFRRQARELQER